MYEEKKLLFQRKEGNNEFRNKSVQQCLKTMILLIHRLIE